MISLLITEHLSHYCPSPPPPISAHTLHYYPLIEIYAVLFKSRRMDILSFLTLKCSSYSTRGGPSTQHALFPWLSAIKGAQFDIFNVFLHGKVRGSLEKMFRVEVDLWKLGFSTLEEGNNGLVTCTLLLKSVSVLSCIELPRVRCRYLDIDSLLEVFL